MASFGHIAVGMAAGRAFSGSRPAGKAALAFSVISMWPDADTVGFLFGVDYGDPWGHRGATHSLAMALVVALLAFVLARPLKLPQGKTALFTGVVAASHGLLDTLTYGGGLGCALLWPFSDERYWAPVRFIPVAPIGPYMFSARGLTVVLVEMVIFAPFWLYAVWPRPGSAAGPAAG
jgi:inner membrane protein